MIIDDIKTWAEANAGKTVRFQHGCYTKNPTGRVLGYKLDINSIVFDGGSNKPIHPYKTVWLIENLDLSLNAYRWMHPKTIDCVIDEEFAIFTKSNKEINNFPHICPRCKGPAYIGFITTIDCKNKCSIKQL
jgi:hypothetical protein